LLGLVVALFAAETAEACTCVYVPPKPQLEHADGAAVLRLVAIRERSTTERELVYRVGRVVKSGPGLRRGRRIAIRSSTVAPCGPIEQVGHLTGLFLQREHDRWTANACSEISAAQMRRLDERVSSAAADGGCAGSAAGA
jgi:hypothetical protein